MNRSTINDLRSNEIIHNESLVSAPFKVATPGKGPIRWKIKALLMLMFVLAVRLCMLGRDEIRQHISDNDLSGGRISKHNDYNDTLLQNQTYPSTMPRSAKFPYLEPESNVSQQPDKSKKPEQNQTRPLRSVPGSDTSDTIAHSKEMLPENLIDQHGNTPQQNQTYTSRTVQGFANFPHFEELQQKNLHLSLKQQKSYFERKDKVVQWLNNHANTNKRHLLDFGGVSCISCFAVIINDKYAFRHIYKTGGSTVEMQAKRKQVRESDYGNRLLLATVRDPIDHFLSGWAECGARGKVQDKNGNATYDERVYAWLKVVKDHQYSWYRRNDGKWYKCENHSFPQANYLLQMKGDRKNDNMASYFHPKLNLIGDMRELPELLGMVGLEFNRTLGNATRIENKELYPRHKSLLSDRTVDALCDYLALDYYLFDFEPPSRCRNQVEIDVTSIMDYGSE